LAVEIDAASLLPADDSSHGFDNVTVGNLSPALLDRYVSAAQKISRLAVGRAQPAPGGDTIRIQPDITQEARVDGLPFGTRGGTLIRHTFERDGEYDIQIRLARDRDEEVEGLREPHEVLVLLDRQTVQSFTVNPTSEKEKDFEKIDAHLKFRLAVKAGPHDLGVTFLKNPSSLLEGSRQPYEASFNHYRHPRLSPAVYQVSITGPFADTGPGDTPSRRRIFMARPTTPSEEEACARKSLSSLMRLAYRRPITEAESERILSFYREARRAGDFEAGIQAALGAILVSPSFLFRVEQDPTGIAPKTPYRISNLELASRLSFFLWSSIPDDELLAAAERGELHDPAVLEKQTRRMLADPRSFSLVNNFADQWLHLRNLDSFKPDLRVFPDFDDNLRQAFRRETELLVEEVIREDRSVLDLLKSDHTWLNERLAKHYGIPNVYGTRFRRVALEADSHRGGLLRHGSILAVTSYATRTSPVLRGKWILANIVGTPPPRPPADVPPLKDNTVSESLPVRQRLMQHRADVACASCHNVIDPPAFALENFDAVRRWRTLETEQSIHASGGLPDGSEFTGVDGLERALLAHPEIFVSTLTEKLYTFALGRGTEYYDAPAVRNVVQKSRLVDYRFSAMIINIVNSPPFQMRNSP
jgi:hypothetical protein